MTRYHLSARIAEAVIAHQPFAKRQMFYCCLFGSLPPPFHTEFMSIHDRIPLECRSWCH